MTRRDAEEMSIACFCVQDDALVLIPESRRQGRKVWAFVEKGRPHLVSVSAQASARQAR
jgi:hypothetical protein